LVIQARDRLQEVARMTADKARDELIRQVEHENQLELVKKIRQSEESAREEADRRARRIIVTAIQKLASEQVMDSTVSVVNLPNDEMKGRIIGREGRNIRMLESMTGVDLIIDDTPEAVVLSCFDPVRREIARVALEKLVADGRIHPARIEEMVEKSRKEMDERIREEGEKAAFEVGITGLHADLIRLMGRLRFRSSYGQNVLFHSIEVALLCAQMAAELGAEVEIVRRAGFLHDIGKALTGEIEGPHAIVGARVCQKNGESADVVHAVEAHHEDVEQRTVEAMIVQACDAISAARPGARRENLDTYIKRLEKLETVANAFDGVERSYAIQAGREIRVLVHPDKIDDLKAARLARDVAKRIEENLDYPGQIKVTVIRETRTFEFAR
jgi:ribonuclease Y